MAGAVAILDEAEAFVRRQGFVFRMPDVAAAQVLTLLRQGHLDAAAQLAAAHDLPISQARVHLAQGDPFTALAVLLPVRQQAEAKGWADERLTVMVLEALALHAQSETDRAVHVLGDVLGLAMPGGFIRLFVDEGAPMAQLLSAAAAQGMMSDYIGTLLAAFEAEQPKREDTAYLPPTTGPAPERAIEPPRARNTPAHGPGTLESCDQRAAVPRREYGERAQSDHLWQAPGPTAHRSGCPCPRAGPGVAEASGCPHPWRKTGTHASPTATMCDLLTTQELPQPYP
jgi:hypothetical protein